MTLKEFQSRVSEPLQKLAFAFDTERCLAKIEESSQFLNDENDEDDEVSECRLNESNSDSDDDYSDNDSYESEDIDCKNDDGWGSDGNPGAGPRPLSKSNENSELEYNLQRSESYFAATEVQLSRVNSTAGADTTTTDGSGGEELGVPPVLQWSTSSGFFKMGFYEEIMDIEELVHFADKDGNTAAHHATYLGLTKSAEELVKAGASLWKPNRYGDTVMSLRMLPLKSSKEMISLHAALTKRKLVPDDVVPHCLACSRDYVPSKALDSLITAIKEDEDDAAYYVDEAVASNVPHAKLYRSVFYLLYSYGPLLAKQDLKDYVEEVCNDADGFIDPLYYYSLFMLWKRGSGGQPSHAKVDKLRAADALKALRAFPSVCSNWLDEHENHDKEIEQNGLDNGEALADIEEDDYDDILPPPGPHDPETTWKQAKKNYPHLKSPSMDALMDMIGLKEVKEKAITVALSVLLDPPTDIDTSTSMNFSFVGNPGTGKTTVSKYIAKAMAELGYRKNGVPVFTSADEILSAQKPVDEFLDCVKKADGGTLMIDEAYLFDPAPKGKQGNDSNKVLDALLKVSETMKLTTTFILCGYKEELLKMYQYNPGFESRFSKRFRFEFADYTELQLTRILADMVKARNLRFESKKECNIAIARVLARRLARGANKKGFGNGRDCEKELEMCIEKQKERLGKMMLSKIVLTDYNYRTLTRADTVGDRPNLEDSSYVQELASMVGLNSVKEQVKNMMNLQLQNHDAEMRGESIQLISLHRVFLGNPGTGKTTVAKLMGKMLKEFGFLSDGDFIMVTPSDLKGSAVGEAAERTRQLLDSAKGKVLFIDEAYNLDPKRHTGGYGAEVIDTILEKIEANAGSDMCLILAGYKPQMQEFFRNANNEGLKRRLNLSEAFEFEDFSDEDIKKVLKNQVVRAGLTCCPTTLDFAVQNISKKRMEDGFGNAGEAEQILTRAKLRLSQRLSQMTSAVPESTSMKLLLKEDFAGEETSSEKAREAFAGLENMGHIEAILDKMEAIVATALAEGRKPHEEMTNMHMLFLGPPGTGKTTCGKRFATMFKQLEVLPTDRFEYTTASQLIDRYVGGTTNNTVEAMKRAKGGILMVDEAYGMLPTKGNWFGQEIMQALLDNITSEEYKGKIVVILGGYKEHVSEIFGMNAGFQSRFDKVRVEFPEWDGPQSASALINRIEADGKEMTEEAKDALPAYFSAMRDLPNWASARDVMEHVRPNLETERASRAFALAKAKRQASIIVPDNAAIKTMARKGKAAKQNAEPPIPYNIEDVVNVFTSAIKARGGNISITGDALPMPKSITTIEDYMEQIASPVLTVVDFYADWCGPCKNIAPFVDQLCGKYTEVVFIKVDVDSQQTIAKKEGVQAMPTFKFFVGGVEMDVMKGANNSELERMVKKYKVKDVTLRSGASTSAAPKRLPPPHPEIADEEDDFDALVEESGPPPPPKVNKKFNFNVQIKTEGGDGDGEDGDELDVWGALEEACAELGWTLDQVKNMLEDIGNFPPPEIMTIIMRTTGCSDQGKIKNILTPQRAGVLQKIKHSIKEAKRAKSAQEAKVQEACKRIGKCCMGFEWLSNGPGMGYRCAGGAHALSDQEVQNELMKDEN